MRDRRRIIWVYAAFFSLWVVDGYFLTSGNNVRGIGYTLLEVLVWYWVAAASVFALVSILGPWATSRARGAMVGFLAAIPLLASVNLVSPTPVHGRKLVLLAVILAVIAGAMLGAPVGAMYWRPPR